jgi:putative DNA primase/helicase
VLNLRTGKLQDNARADYVTRYADVAFDPTATCPAFDAFLNVTFGGDAALIRYVLGVLGYCLTGRTQFQQFWIWTGEGANGKSTLISVMQRLLGDYARSILASTLFEGQFGEQGNYDLALLTGVRLAVAPEAESTHRLHAARLKQLTGGDSVAVRPIYRAPFSFRPCAKIIIVCNRRPDLDTYDDALKRRIRVVPFDHQVPPEQQDHDLVRKLTRELPGILNRLVAAGAEFIAAQTSAPEAVRRATQGYFADKDYISWFIGDCTEQQPGCIMSKAQLYELYLAWSKIECLPHVSKRELIRIMKKKGYEETRSSTMRGWKDLQVRQDDCRGSESKPEGSNDEPWADVTGAAANTA